MSSETNREYVTQTEGNNSIHISTETVCIVAAMAAAEVEGVAGLTHLGKDVASVAAKKNLPKAVRVRSEEGVLSIDLSLLVEFGANIQDVARQVQAGVQAAVESVTGMEVSSVNIHVSGLSFDKTKKEK